MISPGCAATKDYRDGLERTLELARQRLNVNDFEGFAVGIGQEIARLDLELSKYYDVVLPRTPFNWASLLVQGIEICKKPPSIRFNSPSDATWTARTQQLRYFLPDNSINPTYAACGI
jgi:hypothetical protein